MDKLKYPKQTIFEVPIMDKDIEEFLRTFVFENCLPQKKEITFDNNENLFDSGIIDSAALIHLIGFIEKEFDLVIPDDDLIPENFISINLIAHYIRSQIEIFSLK